MPTLDRITLDPAVMGGKGVHTELTGDGRDDRRVAGRRPVARRDPEGVPYLEAEDIDQALAYAAWRVEEREFSLPGA